MGGGHRHTPVSGVRDGKPLGRIDDCSHGCRGVRRHFFPQSWWILWPAPKSTLAFVLRQRSPARLGSENRSRRDTTLFGRNPSLTRLIKALWVSKSHLCIARAVFYF